MPVDSRGLRLRHVLLNNSQPDPGLKSFVGSSVGRILRM